MTRTKTHKCEFCGHEGVAKGKGAELFRDGKDHLTAYYCKDARACGARIRARTGHTVPTDPDALPF